MVSSLFTAFAIEGVPIVKWGYKLVHEALPMAHNYLESFEKWNLYKSDFSYFEEQASPFFYDLRSSDTSIFFLL
jgi:hypothetical protein